MGSRQRKVERHRAQRQKKRRTGQIQSVRRQQQLAGDEHPVYACKANRKWQEQGNATIFFARQVGPGHISMAAFLVDTWAMGLKDAWGRVDVACAEFDELLSNAPPRAGDGSPQPRHGPAPGLRRYRIGP